MADAVRLAAHPHAPDAAFASRITLRRGTEADAAMLLPLINDAYFVREGHLFTGPRASPEQLLDALGADGSRLFVALHDDQIAGCIRLVLRQVSAYFGMLAVAAAYQGRGLAALLIRYVENETLTQGRDTMHLECVQDAGMQPYYEALGYGVTKQTPHDDWGARSPWTLVEMTKRLR